MNGLLTLLFFCSGATALVYEVVWSKYLSLMFGSTVQAQTVVLAVFMGGLALGNRLFGKRSDLLARPVAVYGGIEIAIGIYALLFHTIHGIADGIFIKTGAAMLETSTRLLLLKGALAVALLVIPTVLMGGTLPLVAAWLQRRTKDAGRSSAAFYAINTFGAVFGAGAAGFFLVKQFGLPITLQIAGAVNIVIGVLAVVIARREVLAQAPGQAKTATVGKEKEPPRWMGLSQGTFACALVFFTGAVSLGLEVLASRSLSMIFGASLQAFSVMLMAFILGVGAGGFWVASIKKPASLKESTIAIALLIAAGLIGVFLLTIEQWALVYLKIRHSPNATDKFLYHQLVSTGISLVVIGIPAALIGAVLPLCIRLVAGTASSLGQQVGRLLTFNTLGAVFGALFTGFFLMPVLGLRTGIGVMGVALAAVALAIAAKNHQKRLATSAMVAGACVLFVSVVGREDWQYALSSGIFRLKADDVTPGYFSKVRERDQLLYYRDGTDATVAVVTDRQARPTSERVLSINGKPDGSIIGDLSTEYLAGHLPMLAKPKSKDIFILGFGTGITGGAILGHPIDSLTLAENCAPVLEAGKLFEPWNRGVLTNKLTRIYREDARTVLKLSDKQYDVIISEPSNPWTSGIGSVFSREFYELSASRLKPGGIMAQWFHIYEMNDEVVDLVLRTFTSVFPHAEVWETRNGDLILLGAKEPWESSPKVFAEVFAREQPRKDLEEIDLRTPESVLGRQVCSQRMTAAVPSPGRVQSDAFPILEYEAPKAFYQGGSAYKLFLADERMVQAAFAPPPKREALSAFRDDQVIDIFRRYGSANLNLMEYVAWRGGSRGLSRMHEVYRPAPFLESIFRLPQTFPRQPEVPEDATAVLTQFLHAEALVHNGDTRREGAEKIEALLRSFHDGLIVDDRSNPSIEWYAALAARAYYLLGDLERARQCVDLGLQKAPGDPQLEILQRLLKVTSDEAVRTAGLSKRL